MAHALSPNKALSLQLSAITGLQILVSFAMQWYVITYFGAGVQTDALYTGATIPQLVTILLIESLTVVLVPLLATSSEHELRERGWFLFISVGLLFATISVVLYFTLPLLIPLIVPGFSHADKQRTVALAQIQVFGLIGGACYAVLAGMYQIRDRFVVPPAAIFLSALLSFAMLAWQLPRFGIRLAAWAQVISTTLPAILLLPVLGSFTRPQLPRQIAKTMWTRVRPLLLSKAYYMTSAPLDRILASFLAPGSIAIFELAGRFYGAVTRIISQGMVTPFIPCLSRLAHEQNWAEFRSQYRKQSVMVAVPSLVVVLTVVFAGVVALRLLPATPARAVVGSLSAESLSKMFRVLVFMSGLLPCLALANSLINGYYAKGDTRTPTQVGVIAYTMGMGVKIAGYYAGGIMGMAISVSAYAVVYCMVLFIILEKQTGKLIAATVLASQRPPQGVIQAVDVTPTLL